MTTDETPAPRRLRYLGVNDLATFHLADRAVEILEQFDASSTAYDVGDVLDLHNAQRYVADGIFPSALSAEHRAASEASLPAVRKTVALFFTSISDANIGTLISDLDYEHQEDLLNLCAQFGVFDRCTAAVVLPALEGAGIATGQLLHSKKFVLAYDAELRSQLLADPRNAEHLVRRYLEERRSDAHEIHLPPSLTSADANALLDSYLDIETANPNFVQLIATAPLTKAVGIDAKLKLKAKRTHEDWTTEFFKENTGIKTGCEVSISSEQTEPFEVELDGMVAKFTYGLDWLKENIDYPTILNNFIYLFEFCNRHMQLTLPSYRSELGVFERFLTTKGKGAYLTGASFTVKHQSSFLQIAMYGGFLGTKDIDLETVLAWLFSDYLRDEFAAANFYFTPSTKTATYLERSRHLFSEMESVAKQFALYVADGELDTELLAMGGDKVRYSDLPSLLDGKYAYVNEGNQDIQNIQNLLFSDQTGLGYIHGGSEGATAAELLTSTEVAYTDFADHQLRQIDYLISLGVLENTGERVQIADAEQFGVLKALNNYEAASYSHFSTNGQKRIDDMVGKGWLIRRGSLLSTAEASYFNYYLNNLEFTGGPALRNKYLHGSRANPNDEDEHRNTYVIAMRLLIALVIKINDDFELHQAQTGASPDS